jgi:CDP-diacylglycerol--glycerol-3-phosphate 3-phosphatidyltransferase
MNESLALLLIHHHYAVPRCMVILFLHAMTLSRAFHKRLLRAAQGASSSSRLLRSFPLKAHHFRLDSIAFTPRDFHSELCQRIRSAQRRVHLASLYIGPAADPSIYPQEEELLDSLRATRCPDVRILLDQNRALRPVPTAVKPGETFITSAEACHRALGHRTQEPGVYLMSVLPDWLQSVLSNPYDEVAGVFHIKAYIIDDDLILSGANLSEEYFSDRADRYLWIQQGGNGLVDCYADVLRVLCQHARMYAPPNATNLPLPSTKTSPMNRPQLIQSLTQILTTTKDDCPDADDTEFDSEVVAYAVPTLQAPAHFFHSVPEKERLPLDVQVLEDLLEEAAPQKSELESFRKRTLRLSSAYLNIMGNLRRVLQSHQGCFKTHLLTAGGISHGMKPKPKAGNKGREWIPTVFDELARESMQSLQSHLWFYQREGWSFHAKGIWLSLGEQPVKISDASSLVVVTHGSSNYGGRSTFRDMESNLIMVFPATSAVQQAFADEWNRLCSYAQPSEKEEARTLSWPFRMALPWIRSLF